jgi:hypothetical protein
MTRQTSFQTPAGGPGALERCGSLQGYGSGLRSLKNKTFSRGDLSTFGAEQELQHDGTAAASDMQREVEDAVVSAERGAGAHSNLMRDILDISSPLNDAAAALVDDSFLRCFKTLPDEPWNWNIYLYPLWAVGVVVRNCILFPLRLIILLLGFLVFVAGFAAVGAVVKGHRKQQAERRLVQFLCQVFVVSWTGWLPLPWFFALGGSLVGMAPLHRGYSIRGLQSPAVNLCSKQHCPVLLHLAATSV